MKPFASTLRLHAAVLAAVVFFDQITKQWARARFTGQGGQPDYDAHIAVLGDWLHLRLVYNYGASFGMRPQEILPFLHPVAFFALITLAAIVLLLLYYRKLEPRDKAGRLAIVLVLSGAIGNNLIDRPIFHKVTDFIDVGMPGVHPRFPVFNVADAAVTTGILLLFLAPLFLRKKNPAAPAREETSDAV
ncbi:MAG: lspA [Fibrobacteria bacterium]|nr:lspA [Fibrobacteria bacterium]